jgi:acetyltransferase-like isoleucine patch superfamily enzyme
MKAIIRRIKSKFIYELTKRLKPEMIGYTKWNNTKIFKTIISNTSHISNKQNIEIGNNVFIFHNTYIDGHCKVTISDGVGIGHCTTLVTHSAHNSLRLYGRNYVDTPPDQIKGMITGPIFIGEYTFIGPNCVIMPGTTIGKGCIVAAFSFVSGEFPDFSIIKGNPGVIVGNTQEIDKQFLKRYPELKGTYYNQDAIK